MTSVLDVSKYRNDFCFIGLSVDVGLKIGNKENGCHPIWRQPLLILFGKCYFRIMPMDSLWDKAET